MLVQACLQGVTRLLLPTSGDHEPILLAHSLMGAAKSAKVAGQKFRNNLNVESDGGGLFSTGCVSMLLVKQDVISSNMY